MASSQPCAAIAMKVLVKQEKIAPVGIALQEAVLAKYRATAIRPAVRRGAEWVAEAAS